MPLPEFHSWNVPIVPDWVGENGADYNRNFEKNIERVLGSNPIISGSFTERPHGKGVPYIKTWIKSKLREDMFNFERQGDNSATHRAILRAITKLLAHVHYAYMSGQNAGPGFTVSVRQFWFPASYFVRGVTSEPKFYFLDEKFFHDEFYGRPGGSRHPAVVLEVDSTSRCQMVPLTNTRGEEKQAIEITNGNPPKTVTSYAICRFLFRVSPSMLDNSDYRDRKGHTMSDVDFNLLKKKTGIR